MHQAVLAGTRHRLTTRERAGLFLHALAALALIPAYALLAPQSHWDKPLLLAVLCALAVIAIFHDVRLVRGVHFDATAALALIATALVGPLPALAVIFPPIAVNALCGRERLLRVGNVGNLAAYGWYTLVGGLVLQTVASEPALLPAAFGLLVAVGVLQLLINWAIAPLLWGTLCLGHPVRALVAMLRDALPAGIAMAALAAATVLLFPYLGL